MGRELKGLELGPLFGVAEIVNGSAEIGAKTSEVVSKTSEVSEKTGEIDYVGQEHHVIPRGVKGNEVVGDAIKEEFKFEGAENKITVEKLVKLQVVVDLEIILHTIKVYLIILVNLVRLRRVQKHGRFKDSFGVFEKFNSRSQGNN